MDVQLLLVIIGISGAIFFLSRRFYLTAKGKKAGSCGNCDLTKDQNISKSN